MHIIYSHYFTLPSSPPIRGKMLLLRVVVVSIFLALFLAAEVVAIIPLPCANLASLTDRIYVLSHSRHLWRGSVRREPWPR